jgi:hypothetical protein
VHSKPIQIHNWYATWYTYGDEDDGKTDRGGGKRVSPIPPAPAAPTHKIERAFRTKLEAEDWVATQRVSILQGSYVDARRAERPFADLFALWKESWPNRLSPTTQLRYQSIAKTYLLPEFERTPIAKITHERVQRYINRLSADPAIAPGTIRNVESNGFDSGEVRNLTAKQDPKGVKKGARIASCRPAFMRIESG